MSFPQCQLAIRFTCLIACKGSGWPAAFVLHNGVELERAQSSNAACKLFAYFKEHIGLARVFG
jgi:hypothetical protein